MDRIPLSPQELIQFQSYLNRIRPQPSGQQSGSTGSTGSSVTASGNLTGTLAQSSLQPQAPANLNQPLSVPTGQIQPYQSVRGHPSAPDTSTQLYQNAHTGQGLAALAAAPHGHPSPTTMLTTTGLSMQPFLGRDSLTVSMAGQVNQARRASASHLPRRQTLVMRGGRRRGPATSAPSLARAPTINDCLFTSEEHGGPVNSVRVKVKVYPPLEIPTNDNIFVYTLFRDSFNTKLESHGLIHRYELPISTPITLLLERAASDMQTSPFSYQFTSNNSRGSFLLSHEVLPLQLLSFVNRGVPRPGDQQIRLRRAAHGGEQTIESLLSNRMLYAIPAFAIEGNHFIVNVVVRMYPLVGMLSFSHNDPIRAHSCISRKIYSLFVLDGEFGSAGDDEMSSDNDDSPTAAGAAHRQTSRLRNSPPSSVPTSSSVRSVSSASSSTSSSGLRSTSSSLGATSALAVSSISQTTTPLQRSTSLSSIQLPSSIWSTPWAPRQGHHAGLFSVETLLEDVCGAATSGVDYDDLDVRGERIEDLITTFKAIVGKAVDNNDFTNVLSPDRSFIITTRNHEGVDTTRSLGDGIEREVVHAMLEEYRAAHSQWFITHDDGHATLTTTHSLNASRFVPHSRLRGMGMLGAITALCLIRGMSAFPIDPVLLHYFVHDCDLHAIHPALVGEWHPTLKQTLLSWIALGPHGDATTFQGTFATYCDVQVASLRDRDQASHSAWAAEILHRAVIGTEPASHPELAAFMRGFQLCCRNGFNFCEVLKSWEGGSECFFSLLWTSHISSYDNLKAHLTFILPPLSFRQQLEQALNDSELDFKSLLIDFLKGSGIPCPSLFEEAKIHFGSLVDLSQIQTEGFRARMFCWAVTGSCDREQGAPPISIQFVDNNNPSYGDNGNRDGMIRQGKLSFRTCYHRVLIPASHLISLASKDYPGGSKPSTFREALDHWLLCETLDAIGNHTIM